MLNYKLAPSFLMGNMQCAYLMGNTHKGP